MFNGVCVKCGDARVRSTLLNVLEKLGAKYVGSVAYGNYVVLKVYNGAVVTILPHDHIARCYKCDTIYSFFDCARRLLKMAKKEIVVNPRCSINHLPELLRIMADYRCRAYYESRPIEQDLQDCSVFDFVWGDTAEGPKFWNDVYLGRIPNDLNWCSLLFDIETYKL